MSGNQKGRASAELWSLEQAVIWIEMPAGIPDRPIQPPITCATRQELHKALKAGMITASGCVDAGERRNIAPGEWNDYRLELEHAMFDRVSRDTDHRGSFDPFVPGGRAQLPRISLPGTDSLRQWQVGEPGYHRVITDVLLSREQIVRQWPSAGGVPMPNDLWSDLDSKSGPGAKRRGIEEAIDELWHGEIPKGLAAKDRNNAITDWLHDKRYSVPLSPERAIQRVLKARRSR